MRILTLTALVTFAIDQISKLAVVHGLDLLNRGVIDVFPPYLTFRMAWNRGINFGLFAHNADIVRWALVALALAISAWIWWWIRREQPSLRVQISGGLLIGGALGNVIDRIVYGAVALIVKMDDFGLHLAKKPGAAAQRLGRRLVAAMPIVLSVLTNVGMVAMLWVGGQIILHGLHELGLHGPSDVAHAIQYAVEGVTGPLAGVLGWLTYALASAVAGLALGSVIALVVHAVQSRRNRAPKHS